MRQLLAPGQRVSFTDLEYEDETYVGVILGPSEKRPYKGWGWYRVLVGKKVHDVAPSGLTARGVLPPK